MTRQPDYFYGIDIGGTKMELVACDAGLAVRYRQRVPTPGASFDRFVAALVGLVRGADAALGARGPVGLGVPGIVDARSGAHLSANVPCLTGRQLLPVLRELLARPITLGNDCQCFALSEAHGGAADGLGSMLGLIIGTGAGAGYVVNGQLVRGRNGVAGEWGHWPMAPDLLRRHGLPAWQCACGAAACLECYVSGTGIRRLHGYLSGPVARAAAGELAGAGDDVTAPVQPGAGRPPRAPRGGPGAPPAIPAAIPAEASLSGDGAERLVARRAQGDAMAHRVLALHTELLGAALARIVLAYDPHAIVLGGGLSRMPHLYAELHDATATHLLPGLAVPPILPPAFGDAGGARGAALLARQANFSHTEHTEQPCLI